MVGAYVFVGVMLAFAFICFGLCTVVLADTDSSGSGAFFAFVGTLFFLGLALVGHHSVVASETVCTTQQAHALSDGTCVKYAEVE